MSDGVKLVKELENILQGFYGQTEDQTFGGLAAGIDASIPPQQQEYPLNFFQNENLPSEELGDNYIDRLEENIRDITAEFENRREISERYRLNTRLRAIGLELKILADNFLSSERQAGIIALREAILKKEVLSEEEELVVNLIDSYTRKNEELPPKLISQIYQHLRNCVTSSTFRTALQYLCYNSASVPEELAAACDLASRIYPRFQDLERANSIYNALVEFIEKSLDEVRH